MMQLYRVGSQWLVENIWPKHQLIAFVADEILFCLYEDIRKVDTGRGGLLTFMPLKAPRTNRCMMSQNAASKVMLYQFLTGSSVTLLSNPLMEELWPWQSKIRLGLIVNYKYSLP
jgi:hypothetical protein